MVDDNMDADLSWNMWEINIQEIGSINCPMSEKEARRMRFQIHCPNCGKTFGIRRVSAEYVASLIKLMRYYAVELECSPLNGGCGHRCNMTIEDIKDTHSGLIKSNW
jgi:hypothetical protein